MNNLWSGGQYSLFRIVFGAYLFIHFVHLTPWASEIYSSTGVLPTASYSPIIHLFPNLLALFDAPWFVSLFTGSAALASVLLIIGWKDKLAALWLWYVLTCLFGRNPLTANPSLPFVGWILLAHLFIPAAPYGSWAAKGRVDPAGNWRMPENIWAAAWIITALAYSYSGYTKLISPSWVEGTAVFHVLQNPLARPTFLREFLLTLPPVVLQIATWLGLGLELLFAPLALVRALRPFLWLAMLLMHISLLILIDFADLSFGMIISLAFIFDPAWIRPLHKPVTDTVFYDGHCGLCHRTVRFLLAEGSPSAFRFAPLQSKTFEQTLTKDRRRDLPDSIVLLTHDDRILIYSSAVVYIFQRLGGAWRIVGTLLSLVPRALRDAAYRFIAAIRYKLFEQPGAVCPLIPKQLQDRFVFEIKSESVRREQA